MELLRINLATFQIAPDDAPYVSGVLTLPPDTWADLTQRGYPGVGYWPVVNQVPTYNQQTQMLGAESITVDAANQRVVRTWAVSQIPASQIEAQIVAATQQRLDSFAKATVTDSQGRVHGDYDNVNSISKYQNLTDTQIAAMPSDKQSEVTMFRTDCQYLAATTALTWATMYAILAQVQAGNWPTTGANQQPTGYSDIEPSLPALAWPN